MSECLKRISNSVAIFDRSVLAGLGRAGPFRQATSVSQHTRISRIARLLPLALVTHDADMSTGTGQRCSVAAQRTDTGRPPASGGSGDAGFVVSRGHFRFRVLDLRLPQSTRTSSFLYILVIARIMVCATPRHPVALICHSLALTPLMCSLPALCPLVCLTTFSRLIVQLTQRT